MADRTSQPRTKRQPAGQEAWPYRCVLVTGGSGFLASNVLRRLGGTSSELRRISRRPDAAATAPEDAAIATVVGDVREPAIWESALLGVDLILHFAAQTSARTAERDPCADHDVNVVPMLRLLEACRRKGGKPVVLFSGTATQVGLTSAVPVDELLPDAPVTVYDMHKSMAESYLRYYVREGYVRGASLRLPNLYGPGPSSSSADRGVLNLMIRKALCGETLTIYGTGAYLRDYLYVDDAAEAFLAAAAAIDRTDGRYFVLGSGSGSTIAAAVNLVAERVHARTGRRVAVTHVEPPAPLAAVETRNFVADAAAFSSATGWMPGVALQDGIDLTIEAFLSEGADRP